MTTAALVIWILTLLVVAVIIVPVAVSYLRRALEAARNIERNMRDMLEAGVKIAAHTGAVPALGETINTAVAMRPVSENIEAKTAAVAQLLSTRASKGGVA
jgi:hypothetical protein